MDRSDIFDSLSHPSEQHTREYSGHRGWWHIGLDPVRTREFQSTTFSACFSEALMHAGPQAIAEALERAAGDLRAGVPAAVERLVESLLPPAEHEPRTADV